jgi:hypothetical protein
MADAVLALMADDERHHRMSVRARALAERSSWPQVRRIWEDELSLLLQRRGNVKKTMRRISGYESRSAVYHVNRDYFWLDLERQKESRLEVKSAPYTYQQSGDNLHVVFANGPVFTIREIRPDRQSETVWTPGFQPSGIRISPFGLLVFRDQQYKVYPFTK